MASGSLIADEMLANIRTAKELEKLEFPKPASTRFMAFANQKGGVGKTTSVVNVAAALASRGLEVLVIDQDPQGNASTALGAEHVSGTPSIYEVLTGQIEIAQAVQISDSFPTLSVVPSTIDLAGAEIELVTENRREYILREALEKYVAYRHKEKMPRLDYVIVDCPPSLGILTINALVAADEVAIPIQCEYYALEGLSQLLANIERIKNAFHPGIRVSTILLTMFDPRTNLAQDVVNEVKHHFAEIVISKPIPRSVRIAEAPSYDMTVIEHDKRSSGAIAYMQAAYEISSREG